MLCLDHAYHRIASEKLEVERVTFRLYLIAYHSVISHLLLRTKGLTTIVIALGKTKYHNSGPTSYYAGTFEQELQFLSHTHTHTHTIHYFNFMTHI